MGLIGPNGAGKSTLIRILLGLVHQDSGSVQVLGQAMPDQQVAAKWQVGFASEDMRLYGQATLDWHIRFISSIYPSWDAAYAKSLLRRFDLKEEQKIKGLSHGQRVKAVLLLILARRPRLLLLDEPTTGLDPVARQEVLAELSQILADDERTILFSSHNTTDVERLSDQITFIDRGRIIDTKDKENFLEEWRRIQITLPPGIELTELPSLGGNVVDIKKDGRLLVAIVKAYHPDIAEAYRNKGATIHKIERLTLEEIFLASVQNERKGEIA
jgi:ABC-2 type transport system ATP-binding protein